MKVPVRIKKNTELARGENLSSSAAGPLKTLGEINDPVVAAHAPTGSPRARNLNLHGFPGTLVSLGEFNDSVSGPNRAQGLIIQAGTGGFTGKRGNPLGIAREFACHDETQEVLRRPLDPIDFKGFTLTKLVSRRLICGLILATLVMYPATSSMRPE